MPGGIAVHQMPLVTSRDRLVEVVAPLGGGGRLDAEAEEAEAGEREDRLGALSVKISGSVRVELRSTWRNMMRDVRRADHLAPTRRTASALTRTTSARIDAEVLRDEHDGDRDRRGQDAAPQARLPAADRRSPRRSRAAGSGTRRSRRRSPRARGRASRRSSRRPGRAGRRRRSRAARATTITRSAVCAPQITRESTS